MAIIRIKRTTGNTLPTGLTFGEMAFVQGSGKTANRLYIANNAGVCVWVGAQIINQPTFWSADDAAETTVPTLSAVESRVVAGGGLTFASNLNVNIAAGKYFGKYTRGDIIPAQGQTVKWLIEDALVERITPTVGISFSNGSDSIPWGQTQGINYTLTLNYTVRTVGATVAGATLEWKRSNDSTWNVYQGSNVYYDTSAPFSTNDQYFTYSPAPSGITLNPLSGGQPNTNDFDYRYTIHDTSGASASFIATKAVADSKSQNTQSLTANHAAGVVSPETQTIRERGRVQSNVTGTITVASGFNPITEWKLQVSTDGGSSWSDVNSFQVVSNPWNQVTGSTINIGTISHTPASTISSVRYRTVVRDPYDTVGPIDTSIGGRATVNFFYKLFYGPTASQPTTAAQVRTMPLALMSNSYTNPFTFQTGNQYKDFVVALPTNIDIAVGGQQNEDALLDSPGFVKSTTLTTANDAAGNSKAYNVWTLNVGVTYGDGVGGAGQGNRFRITTTGTAVG